jgi:hypothetical protein
MGEAFLNAQTFVQHIDADTREYQVLSQRFLAFKNELKQAAATQEEFREWVPLLDKTKVVFAEKVGVTFQKMTATEDVLPQNVVPVLAINVGDQLVYASSLTEYEKQIHQVIERKELQEKVEKLNQELDLLKDWVARYDGVEKELIPTEEIQQLNVRLVSKGEQSTAYISEVLDGEYTRNYADISAYLASFGKHKWTQSPSFENAQRYMKTSDNPQAQAYELARCQFERVMIEQAEKEGNSALSIARKDLWEQMQMVPFEQIENVGESELFFYQEKERIGNPIYFETMHKMIQFVERSLEKNQEVQQEKQARQKENDTGFFRRVLKEEPEKNQANEPEKKGFFTRRKEEVLKSVQVSKNSLSSSTKQKVEPVNDVQKIMAQTEELAMQSLTEKDYQTYLDKLTQFPKYSFRNVLLLMKNAPNATAVATFAQWQHQFSRTLNNNAKAIELLCATTVKEQREVKGKMTEIPVRKYVSVPVFDVTQTSGAKVPELLEQAKLPPEKLYQALAQTTDWKVRYTELQDGKTGELLTNERTILLQKGMGAERTLTCFIEQLVASKRQENIGQLPQKEQALNTFEQLSIAYVLCRKYDLPTSEFSFSNVEELQKTVPQKELLKSFANVQHQVQNMVQEIEFSTQELVKEQAQSKQLVSKIQQAKERAEMYNEQVKKSKELQQPARQQTQIKEK